MAERNQLARCAWRPECRRSARSSARCLWRCDCRESARTSAASGGSCLGAGEAALLRLVPHVNHVRAAFGVNMRQVRRGLSVFVSVHVHIIISGFPAKTPEEHEHVVKRCFPDERMQRTGLSRRRFVAAAALAAAGAALPTAAQSPVQSPKPGAAGPTLVYVGSYSSPQGPEGSRGHGRGIYLFVMDQASGSLTLATRSSPTTPTPPGSP